MPSNLKIEKGTQYKMEKSKILQKNLPCERQFLLHFMIRQSSGKIVVTASMTASACELLSNRLQFINDVKLSILATNICCLSNSCSFLRKYSDHRLYQFFYSFPVYSVTPTVSRAQAGKFLLVYDYFDCTQPRD